MFLLIQDEPVTHPGFRFLLTSAHFFSEEPLSPEQTSPGQPHPGPMGARAQFEKSRRRKWENSEQVLLSGLHVDLVLSGEVGVLLPIPTCPPPPTLTKGDVTAFLRTIPSGQCDWYNSLNIIPDNYKQLQCLFGKTAFSIKSGSIPELIKTTRKSQLATVLAPTLLEVGTLLHPSSGGPGQEAEACVFSVSGSGGQRSGLC